MKKIVIFGIWLLLFLAVPGVKAADPGRSPASPPSGNQKIDRTRETACACCQKCMAARKPVKPDQERKKPAADGCEECCSRCGQSIPQPDKTAPPEIPEEK
jgi:hypothetical protein